MANKFKFYVYVYLDAYNIPFYVGKGKGNRYYISGHLTKYTTNHSLKNRIQEVGIDNIKIQFLHKNLTEEKAFEREIYWIKYYGRRDLKEGTLYNLTKGGEGSSLLSKETKQKMSKAAIKRFRASGGHLKSTKDKISKANKGKVRSVETKQKLSEAHKGQISPNKGKKFSKAHKQRISKALKGVPGYWAGKKLSIEHRQKLSLAHKGKSSGMNGKSHTEETKRKISATKRKRKLVKGHGEE